MANCRRCLEEYADGTGSRALSEVKEARGAKGAASILCQAHNMAQRRGRDDYGWWKEDHWPETLLRLRRNSKLNEGKEDCETPPEFARPDGKESERDEKDGEGKGKADGQPEQTEEQTAQEKIREELQDKLDEFLGRTKTSDQIEEKQSEIDELEKKIQELEEQIEQGKQDGNPPKKIQVEQPDKEPKEIELDDKHFMFALVLEFVSAGIHVYCAGPAGSGKTHMSQQIADALGRPFYMTGKLDSKYELVGFVAADGQTIVKPSLRHAVEEGALFMWDEFDRSDPKATVAFNAGLANGMFDFPDGTLEVAPEFVSICNNNTDGRGANFHYNTAEQQDGATLDRFAYVPFPYDEHLELKVAGFDPEQHGVEKRNERFYSEYDDETNEASAAAFVTDCQTWRHQIEELKMRHLITPRASIFGAKMLRRGIAREWVETAFVWRGLETAQIEKIKRGG